MGGSIPIETADAGGAAFLMRDLCGRFRAELTERDGGRWEIVVQGDGDSQTLVKQALAVVQRWLDATEAHPVTLHLDDRTFTLGPEGDLASARQPDLLRTGEAL